MNVCLNHRCTSCCVDTEMLLLNDDVKRIVALGFKKRDFTYDFSGFKKLRNFRGRCVFHDGEGCTIYSSRPLGCTLYPVVFDEDQNLPVRDILCPFRAEFDISSRVRRESSKLYFKLMGERREHKKSGD